MTVVMECPKCGSTEIEKNANIYRCQKCGYSAEPQDEVEKELSAQADNVMRKS